MTKRGWFAAGGILVVLVAAACGVESVQAKDYRQGCSTAADCVLVDQLVDVPGSNVCTVPCKGAINKNDKDKYGEEYDQEHHDCSSIHASTCTGNQVAVCDQGTCKQAFQLDDGGVQIPDAGTD